MAVTYISWRRWRQEGRGKEASEVVNGYGCLGKIVMTNSMRLRVIDEAHEYFDVRAHGLDGKDICHTR